MTLKSKLEVTHTIRKHWYGFLFAFHSIYGSILHHFRDRARYWSNNVIFFIRLLHLTPLLGGPCRSIAIGMKNELSGYPKVKNFDMFICFDRIPVCDRRTDGRTNILPWHSLHYAHMSHGENCPYT